MCQKHSCDETAEVTIYFHGVGESDLSPVEEKSYCVECAEKALQEFKDARVGEPL
jgi:hypothetical protein